MKQYKHEYRGVLTGNPYQNPGRHRFGIELIPLGDRKRDISHYADNELIDRDSVDIGSSHRR